MSKNQKNQRSTPKNLQVLHEDNHIIVINKRPGDIVQGDKTQDMPLSEIVKSYIKKKYNKPGNVYLGVAHRLDRPTSGIVVFARTSKALTRINKIFAEKKAKKTYWAIVRNPPKKKEDVLTHWLQRNPKQNKSYAYEHEIKDGKKAILAYRIIRELNNHYLLEVDLKTGRHHQIRAQLAAIDSPIKGDLKYGFKRSNPNGSIHLHARQLSFVHPVNKEMIEFVAAPPSDSIWNACCIFP